MVVMPAMMPQGPDIARTDLCAVVLAAGEGRRLRPLTRLRPKVLCPVGNIALLDHALERVRTVTPHVAVNVHHGRAAVEAHLAPGSAGARARPPRRGRDNGDPAVHVSVEEPEVLGTAGALGHLRDWIDGRPVLVVNGDTWATGSLAAFVDSWGGECVRVLVAGDDRLRPSSQVVASLLPWSAVAPLGAVPSGLYEVVWRERAVSGLLDVVRWDGPCHDCGTPARYLAANLAASGGRSVVGDGAVVAGTVERSVLWPGTEVRASERLVDAIRADGDVTVLVR
jgi:N-acetyl-alpha-D-muramate 1-phosphate uridylyltransferase